VIAVAPCYVSVLVVVLMMIAVQVGVIAVAPCYVSVVAAQVAMPCHSLLLSNNS
jgi:hypothetical protein